MPPSPPSLVFYCTHTAADPQLSPWAAVEVSRVWTWMFPAWCLLAVLWPCSIGLHTKALAIPWIFLVPLEKLAPTDLCPMTAVHSYSLFSDNLPRSHPDHLRVELSTCGPLFYMPQEWTCLRPWASSTTWEVSLPMAGQVRLDDLKGPSQPLNTLIILW